MNTETVCACVYVCVGVEQGALQMQWCQQNKSESTQERRTRNTRGVLGRRRFSLRPEWVGYEWNPFIHRNAQNLYTYLPLSLVNPKFISSTRILEQALHGCGVKLIPLNGMNPKTSTCYNVQRKQNPQNQLPKSVTELINKTTDQSKNMWINKAPEVNLTAISMTTSHNYRRMVTDETISRSPSGRMDGLHLFNPSKFKGLLTQTQAVTHKPKVALSELYRHSLLLFLAVERETVKALRYPSSCVILSLLHPLFCRLCCCAPLAELFCARVLLRSSVLLQLSEL